MILVVEDRRRLPEAMPAEPPRCSLQQTLRRMGFHAARAPRPAPPPRPAAATRGRR